MKRLLVSLIPIALIMAVGAGYCGVASWDFATGAFIIMGLSGTVTIFLVATAVRRQRHRSLLVVVCCVGLAAPVVSLLTRFVCFQVELRPAERFFERSFPALLSYREKHGVFPDTFSFPCTNVPALLEPSCRNGFINYAYYNHDDVFLVQFFPPKRYQPSHSWVARCYASYKRGSWGWAIVD